MLNRNECPECLKEIKNLKSGEYCRHCNALLRKVVVNDEKYFVPKYLSDDEVERIANEVLDKHITNEYETIVDDADYKVKVNKADNKAIVLFIDTMITWEIRCPVCNALHFKNGIMVGSSQHKCRRCGCLVDYVFERSHTKSIMGNPR